MVYSIGSLLELAYLSDNMRYLTEKQQKQSKSICLYRSTFFWRATLA